ncbi:MAG: hypothetical protein JWO42_1702, partial [Chloroflexi bacterium]|nr:hypothetical protein [Chloroflexota bacterium]
NIGHDAEEFVSPEFVSEKVAEGAALAMKAARDTATATQCHARWANILGSRIVFHFTQGAQRIRARAHPLPHVRRAFQGCSVPGHVQYGGYA